MKLKGQKINLRPPKLTDAQSIYINAKDKSISRYTTLPYPYKLKDSKEFIRKTFKERKNKSAYHFGIEDKKTGKIIGMISLTDINKQSKRAEIGYWLSKKYWRQGIASEAVKLVLEFGFKKLKLQKIFARVMHPNIASANLLLKHGFKPEGRLRKHNFKNNCWLDELRFGLLKDYKK